MWSAEAVVFGSQKSSQLACDQPQPLGCLTRCRQPGRWVISHVRWSSEMRVLKNRFLLWCYRALKEVKISIKWKLFVNLSFWHNFRFTEKLQQQYKEFLCGVFPDSGGHNPLLSCHYFLCSLDPRSGRWKPIRLSPPSLTLSLSFFEHFLSCWLQRMFQMHLETSCSSPGIGPFLGALVIFTEEEHLETRV